MRPRASRHCTSKPGHWGKSKAAGIWPESVCGPVMYRIMTLIHDLPDLFDSCVLWDHTSQLIHDVPDSLIPSSHICLVSIHVVATLFLLHLCVSYFWLFDFFDHFSYLSFLHHYWSAPFLYDIYTCFSYIYSEQQNCSTKSQISLVSQIMAQQTKVNLCENYITKVDILSFIGSNNKHLALLVDFILTLG